MTARNGVVVRPVRPGDLPDLLALAASAGSGLTTLPAEGEALGSRIDRSLHAFARRGGPPEGEAYLMVLEDRGLGRVVGTSGIFAGVGLSKAFYSYRILTLTQCCAGLGIKVDSRLLQLVNDYAGATEVGTLYLAPAWRRESNGALLSGCRYLMMACFPERFPDLVMAEMRGWQDEDGRSPFWEALGRKFFRMSFAEADLRSGLGDSQFIADLMPKHPIYVELLPPEAQAVIGKPHDAARPALRLLQKEGFRLSRAVDIFDAGPVVDAWRQDIRSVRESRVAAIARLVAEEEDLVPHLAARLELDQFRAARVRLRPRDDGRIDLAAAAAPLLDVVPGDALRVTPLPGGPA